MRWVSVGEILPKSMEPWVPVVIGITLYAYVSVFNRMMRHPVGDWMEIPRIYDNVNK